MSGRSSNLFTDQQKQDRWRSSSKPSEFRPLSGECQSRNCFRKSVDHAGKHSSIDLSWNECRNTKQMDSMTFSMKQMDAKNQEKLFQNKKRTGLSYNYSSLQLWRWLIASNNNFLIFDIRHHNFNRHLHHPYLSRYLTSSSVCCYFRAPSWSGLVF